MNAPPTLILAGSYTEFTWLMNHEVETSHKNPYYKYMEADRVKYGYPRKITNIVVYGTYFDTPSYRLWEERRYAINVMKALEYNIYDYYDKYEILDKGMPENSIILTPTGLQLKT